MAELFIKDRINEKIIEIEKFKEELYSSFTPDFTLEEYKRDIIKKALFERYLEKIIEAIEDLAFLTINYKELKHPEYENQVFDILSKKNIISQTLSKRLKDAKEMRNFIAHQYGKIDDVLVFYAITEEFEKDVNDFLESVKKVMK